MIDRKMTRADFTHELMRRIVSRLDPVTATDAEVGQAIQDVADEIGTEIKAYWAGLELEARRKNGERSALQSDSVKCQHGQPIHQDCFKCEEGRNVIVQTILPIIAGLDLRNLERARSAAVEVARALSSQQRGEP